MSDPVRIALVGATGLVGRRIVEAAVGRSDIHLVAIARREMKLPKGARMEMLIADPSEWKTSLSLAAPDVLVSALGTTFRKAGRDAEAFQAVDHDLVLSCAEIAKALGVTRMVTVSSTGAYGPSKNLYLSTKGKVEDALYRLKFRRLDILRPGLLRGAREGDARPVERIGKILSPISDHFMHGGFRKYRSIDARRVAEAALDCALTRTPGRVVHDNDAILRAARHFSAATPTVGD